jgi:hypothetical protein
LRYGSYHMGGYVKIFCPGAPRVPWLDTRKAFRLLSFSDLEFG